MMFKIVTGILMLCCSAFSVLAAVEISLNGTVKDDKGTAISGAVVTLSSDTLLKDTTDVSGKFNISNETSIRKNDDGLSLQNIRNISIKNNYLRIFISSPATHGAVSVFSVNGEKCVGIDLENLKQGLNTHKLPLLTDGFYLMSVRIDQHISTCKLVQTGNEIYVNGHKEEEVGSAQIFRNAAVENIDTLIIIKKGFTIVRQPVGSYKQTGIEITMKQETSGLRYAYGASVENSCSDCVVPELVDASKLTVKNSKLPDPFKKINGTRITKKSEWRCRRQEILLQAMKYIYGEKPVPPQVVIGTVTNTKITVHVEDNGKKIDFSATVKLPTSGKAPYPAIITMGSFGSEISNKASSQGVAVITYDYSKLGAEQQPEGNVDRNKDFTGLFYDIYGGKHSAGLLMAWAWGASRMIDVLQKSGSDIIDYRRLATTGCSRMAKGAFAVALFDERVALALPEETSVVGIPAYRIADAKCSENTDNNFRGQLWLSNNFKPFIKNTNLLPIDAHEIIATFAPRGLYSMENQAATQMCAQGGNMAIQGAMDVYNALGCSQNLSYNSKAPNGTGHCSYTDNFTDMLNKNISKFLNHQPAQTGGIVAGGSTLNKSDWIDWNAPTLENDTDLYETD